MPTPTVLEKTLSPTEASKLLTKWRNSPLDYIRDVQSVDKIWRLQRELLEAIPIAIQEHKHIYIGSGHALGKDFITSGCIAPWFLHCYEPSIVIETAPTDRQVKKIMWGETMKLWRSRKLDLGGNPYTNPYLEIRKEDWYLLGFTTKETGASADAAGGKFQGFHSPNICIIVSEAQAVEDLIYDQIDGIATSEIVLVIYIGNPTRAKGRFAKGLRDKVNNIVFNFSCLDNPNYIQRKTVIPGLASYEWVEDKRKKWGEHDPRWQGRVEGRIPDIAVNHIIGDSDIELMKSKHGFLAQYSFNAGVAVDPAGEGEDDNVFYAGRGGEIVEKHKQSTMAPSVSAIQAVEMCKRIHGSFVIVDCDGIGIGVWQELAKLPEDYIQGIQMIKFHGSAPASISAEGPAAGSTGKDRPIYANMRAEAAFATQKRAREGRAAIDENDKELIEDLLEPEYFTNNKGLIQIEDKEDIKERLERSPGCGDSYNMLQWALNKYYKKQGGWREESRKPKVVPDNTDVLVGGLRQAHSYNPQTPI